MALLSARCTTGVCSLFVLKYFIFCLDSFYLSLFPFSPTLSLPFHVLSPYFASSPRFVASFRGASLHVATHAPPPFRFDASFRLVALACVASFYFRRFRFYRSPLKLGWRSASIRPQLGFDSASSGLGSVFRTLGLRPYTVALSW